MWWTEDRAAETAQVRELLSFCEMLCDWAGADWPVNIIC